MKALRGSKNTSNGDRSTESYVEFMAEGDDLRQGEYVACLRDLAGCHPPVQPRWQEMAQATIDAIIRLRLDRTYSAETKLSAVVFDDSLLTTLGTFKRDENPVAAFMTQYSDHIRLVIIFKRNKGV